MCVDAPGLLACQVSGVSVFWTFEPFCRWSAGLRVKDEGAMKRIRIETALGKKSGFTLIELILVMVIIAILAGMVTLSFRGRAQEARTNAALGDIKSYESAIELYALENNDAYPDTFDALVSGERNYIRDLKKDPWGNSYVYLIPGQHHKDSFDVYSMGPDGLDGTEDDIAPWDRDVE